MSILLVTGASSEIGIALMRNFSHQYELIWAHYRTMNSAFEELITERKNIRPIKADFMNGREVQNLIKLIEDSGLTPDSIVHLPAIKYQLNNFTKIEDTDYENAFKVSVMSIVAILKKFVPYMVDKEQGRIVFMLSSCTLGNPPSFSSSYTTIKFALLGLMKELSEEYASCSICINGISPEMIETKFLSTIPRLIVQKNAREMPKGRNLTVEELMATFKYLLFDGKITGQNIFVCPL